MKCLRTIWYCFMLCTAYCICCGAKLSAQDFSYSQFYEQPILRNPALAGLFNGDLRVSGAYRDQWASVTVPFRTTSLSIEYKSPIGKGDDFITLGSQFSLDGAGDIRLKRTQLLPCVNYHKSLSGDKDSYLSLSFIGGPVFSQFDPTQIKWGDQYRNGAFSASNPSAQVLTANSYQYWDMGAGIAFSSELPSGLRFYMGGSIAHANNPQIRSALSTEAGTIAARYGFNIGINGKVSERDFLTAFGDYFMQSGNRQFMAGLLYGIGTNYTYSRESSDALYLGTFIRWNDALIPVIKLQTGALQIGLSYDINISSLKTASNWRGGLELSLGYTGFLKIRNSTLDRVRCVRF